MALASVAALAGCSADVSRFDLGYSDGARAHNTGSGTGYGTTGRTASSDYGSAGGYRPADPGRDVARADLAPVPQQGMTTSAIHPEQGQGTYGGQPSYGQQRQPGYGAAPQYNTQAYNAPSYGQPSYGAQGGSQYGSQPAPSRTYGSGSPSRVAPIASPSSAAATGETIEVRPGDTLYSLSRQHGVSVNDLKSANGLHTNELKPGQQLALPSGTRAHTASETARPPREAYETVAVRPVQSASAAQAPSDWSRSYTVRQGDSLYQIARENGVKLEDLERNNGISDSRKVKPGTELKLPAEGGREVAEATPPARDPAPATVAPVSPTTPGVVALGAQPNPPPAASTPRQPTMINGTGLAGPAPERVATAESGSANDAGPPLTPQGSGSVGSGSVAGTSKLRWPVSGKVVSPFGPRADGTHNDGVNLAVPMGTDVHAAEGGVVAYAGDELAGYGNLVLVRHDNGWVTAYAHADEILVKRGDQIKRGQVIARAGRTGKVDQPQVHFELRQGQKPIDPTPFMERL
ncbi:MAG: peptidoglycan DD-metalloendopeptidase family protein [Hyphomicrobium sp.]|uniref:peptidoglycan DD-metalloendopeptidase family protein n=1 Tax=Hyphomicrobium sp. TaxID=82 RepID=UPI003D0A30E5